MSLFRLSIFKKSKINKFEYQPMYHDSVKEELQQRVKSAQNENDKNRSLTFRKSNISKEFKSIREHSTLFASKEKA